MPQTTSTLLKWRDAERYITERLGLSPEAYYALADEYRGIAYTVSRTVSISQILRIKRKLAAIVDDGGTLDDFWLWSKNGFSTWNRAYSNLVHRMGTFGGYNKARFRELADPRLNDDLPFLMYDAINDDRTRDEHVELDRLTWRADEFPDELWPPNGYNCRCEVRRLTPEMAQEAEAKQTSGPPPESPDEGFNANQNRPGYLGLLAEFGLNRVKGLLGG